MNLNSASSHRGEGALREQLAAFFLAQPPLSQQSEKQKALYLKNLRLLGELERQEFLQSAGGGRPLVWGNPAPLIQSFLCAAQQLAAKLGQPLLLFPAKGAAIGADTLFHPRLLTVALAELLCHACLAAPRQSVWVRLQEQLSGLAVTVTTTAPISFPEPALLIKECTRLHGGSLVHKDTTILFSCGQTERPPAGTRLYCCPTEEELLQDSLSPVWSGFYAGLYHHPAYASGDEPSTNSTFSSSSLGNNSSLAEDSSKFGVSSG